MQSLHHEIAKTKQLIGTLHSKDFTDLNYKELENELSRNVSNWEESTRSYL